ncbi:MAG: hypothetical protein WCI05_14805, partial [Myxococcales bacterium]
MPIRASKIVFERGGLGTAALLPPRSKTIFLARMGKEDVEGEGGWGGEVRGSEPAVFKMGLV